MKLSQFRNFIAVVEAGTFRQAAKKLNLSQSSISKSIQQLEDDLGTPMLHRGIHGVVPTDAGKVLLAHAKAIEAELRHARSDVQMVQGAQIGEIRLSASPSVAIGLLPRAIVAFQRTHPKVSFRISEGVYPDILPGLRSGDIDLAICLVPARSRDPQLNYMSLVKDQLVPAVRKNHPLMNGKRLKLGDLLDLNWVIYGRGHTGLDVFEQTFASNHFDMPKGTIECTSIASAIALVENGDYITLVPSQIFMTSLTPPSIVQLPLDTPMQPWQVAIISRATHEMSAVCSAFLDEIQRMAVEIGLPRTGTQTG